MAKNPKKERMENMENFLMSLEHLETSKIIADPVTMFLLAAFMKRFFDALDEEILQVFQSCLEEF